MAFPKYLLCHKDSLEFIYHCIISSGSLSITWICFKAFFYSPWLETAVGYRPMTATTHLIRITNSNTGPTKRHMTALHLSLLGHGWLVHDCMMVYFLICFVVDWLFLQWRLCDLWADHDWLSLSSCWSSVWTGEPGVCCMVSLLYYTFACIIVTVIWSPSHPLSLSVAVFLHIRPLHYALCFSFSFQSFFRF